MSTPSLPPEPHEGLKADAGAETQQAEHDQSSYVSRAGSSGTVDTGPGPGDEQPAAAVTTGTAGGNALSGVTADADDLEDAVSGDTGPEHPGTRRST